MKILKHKCDYCTKESEGYNVKDWIQIEGTKIGDLFTIRVSGGKKPDGGGITEFYKSGIGLLDFCSKRCLVNYISGDII